MALTQGAMRIVPICPRICRSDIDGVHAPSPTLSARYKSRTSFSLFGYCTSSGTLAGIPFQRPTPSNTCPSLPSESPHMTKTSCGQSNWGCSDSVNQEASEDLSYATSSSRKAEILGVYHNLALRVAKSLELPHEMSLRCSYRCIVTD